MVCNPADSVDDIQTVLIFLIFMKMKMIGEGVTAFSYFFVHEKLPKTGRYIY